MSPIPLQPAFLSTTGEPPLQELLDDPTLHLLMQRDGVHMDDLTDLIALTRKCLRAA